jgi:hypothetical protein
MLANLEPDYSTRHGWEWAKVVFVLLYPLFILAMAWQSNGIISAFESVDRVRRNSKNTRRRMAWRAAGVSVGRQCFPIAARAKVIEAEVSASIKRQVAIRK